MSEQKINFKNNYKGILLDLEGVIYEGSRLIDGSIETINKLLAHGFKIKYLTNTTTISRRLVFEKLLQFHLYRLWFRGAWLMAPGNRTPLNNFEYLSLENIKTFL